MKKKLVFSGIQPTGNLHLGNYFGAILNWIDLQNHYQCLFGLMDLHSITVPQDPKQLQENILLTAASYIACGINPKTSKIFIQSEIAAHCELAWLLGTITPLGWLNRMTQFKEKSTSKPHLLQNTELFKNKNMVGEPEFTSGEATAPEAKFNSKSNLNNENIASSANLGLYSYPVLMAADILLYKADLVPVGEDQKQHLELTRDLAQAFNRRFNCQFFKPPEIITIKCSKRIMSLVDGTKKMSKSDISELSKINLCDSADEISKKIKKAKTDSIPTISYDEDRAEIFNLLNIFACTTGEKPEKIAQTYENSGFGSFKNDLAESLIAHLSPISRRISNLMQDKGELRKILDEGQNLAKEIANQTKNQAFQIAGIKS